MSVPKGSQVAPRSTLVWGRERVENGVRAPHRAALEELGDPTDVARFLALQPEFRGATDGFHGYGATGPGDKALIVTDTHYDPQVPELVAMALEEQGAVVDLLRLDAGPDREFREDDEFDAMMRRVSWTEWPRRYEGVHWVEELAAKRGYDLLVMGRGGPGPIWPTPFRYEQIPWFDLSQLTSPANTFPVEVNVRINQELHRVFMEDATGGSARLRDSEGTDVEWSYFDEYYTKDHPWIRPDPVWGHIFAHPVPPLIPRADARGVVAGTLNHFSRPFPRVEAHIEAGALVQLDGGGLFGDSWRSLLDQTRDVQYPCFPRPGLFWLFEVAIGTNPKVVPVPPERMKYLSSGGVEKERNRAGAIHVGIGTNWRDEYEDWAVERGLPHGHLHVHLFFATLDITTKDNRHIRVIDDGHLTLLDDPRIRDVASKYGDPDEVLSEAWTPRVPGISVGGSYESDYAAHPAEWVYTGMRDA